MLLTAFLKTVDLWRENSTDRSSKIVIGCPISGRFNEQISSLIGYFLNNIILSVNPKKIWSNEKKSLIDYIKKKVDKANRYSKVPFHKAVALLQDKRQLTDKQNPVFQVNIFLLRIITINYLINFIYRFFLTIGTI